MHKVDASRLDLARQFRASPFGPHGSELQKLLKILRWDPIEDRIIAVQQQRGEAWQLARSTGPKGHPVEIFDGPGYATPAEAQWAIFRSRWERHTGQPLLSLGEEELTHTHSAINGETCPLVRCDMAFYETPRGGAVFSTSSIAWAGALAHNDYDNNVSRITENVVRRFLDPKPV